MKRVMWLGLGGVLLLGASSLMLKNRGYGHGAQPVHHVHHHHGRLMAAYLQQQQPAVLTTIKNGAKPLPVQLDETPEPPLAGSELLPSIQKTSFVPMEDGPQLLPGSVSGSTKEPLVNKPATKSNASADNLFDDLFRALTPKSNEVGASTKDSLQPGKNTVIFGFEIGPHFGPFFDLELKKEDQTTINFSFPPKPNNGNKVESESIKLIPPHSKSVNSSDGKIYTVRFEEESLQDIAKRTLGDVARWLDIAKMNPTIQADKTLNRGTVIQLPADAVIDVTDLAKLQPLPGARPKSPPEAPKVVLPLTGTYPCLLDGKRLLTLPPIVMEQLGNPDQLLLSPGPDVCLWLTGPAHIQKLSDRLEQSGAAEKEVRIFRRLFFGQIEKLQVVQSKLVIPERQALFAQLEKEIALVGVEDHFEVWDLQKWREYTQKQAPQEKK
ncbi:MAG: hypothetical protein RIR17_1495 [Planctomycetota bacterium]